MTKSKIKLEICCGSVDDVVQAYAGGCDQVELNSALYLGGLTPSIGMLKTAKRRAPEVKIYCMVRPRQGGFCYTDLEFESMVEDAKALVDSGADGIVFGILRPDGRVDMERSARLISAAGDVDHIFHRAIDVVPDAEQALDSLMELGVDRVLTSGQQPVALQGAQLLSRLVQRGRCRIEILAGGGVRAKNARELIEKSGVGAVHMSAHRPVDGGITAKAGSGELIGENNQVAVVDSRVVREMRALLDDLL